MTIMESCTTAFLLCRFELFFDSHFTHVLQNGWNNVRNMYNNDGDVDLYVGLLMEQPMQNAEVGPTAGCIIVDQFLALRGNFFLFN